MEKLVQILWTVVVFIVFFALAVITLGWFGGPAISLPLGAWLIVSWCNTVNPDYVALRRYFGHLEKYSFWIWEGPLKSGLHFVPWFPGIKLIKIPKKLFRLTYEMDPTATTGSVMSGTMFGVRSKNKQKMFVEATFFLRFPYDHVDPLIRIIESGVPLEEDALKNWIEDAIAPEILYVFGQKDYEEVMGGLSNKWLSKKVNKRLRGDPTKVDDSLLERCGLFGTNPDDVEAGSGEAYLRIEDVHLQGPLGARLELVETTKLEEEARKKAANVRIGTAKFEAEAAEHVAEKRAMETHGRVFMMVAKTYGLTPKELKDKLAGLTDGGRGEYKEAFDRAYDLIVREEAAEKGELTDIRIGGTDGTPLKDAGIGALIAGLGAFFQQKGSSGGGGSGGGGSSGAAKSGGKGRNAKGNGDDDYKDFLSSGGQ